jgi:hypothetical protein
MPTGRKRPGRHAHHHRRRRGGLSVRWSSPLGRALCGLLHHRYGLTLGVRPGQGITWQCRRCGHIDHGPGDPWPPPRPQW